jgi:hypothetical protein
MMPLRAKNLINQRHKTKVTLVSPRPDPATLPPIRLSTLSMGWSVLVYSSRSLSAG